MSKLNLRSHLKDYRERPSVDKKYNKTIQQKNSLKTSYSTSMNQSSSNSSANISFLKDMNFPKLFDQTPMLFSFNPQTTKNSTTMVRSTSSSGLNSGSRTPNSSCSYSSFKGFFKSKEQSKSKNNFSRKQKDITIDLSKKPDDLVHERKFHSKDHRHHNSLFNKKNSQISNCLITNPADLIPKEENIKVYVRIKPQKIVQQQNNYIRRLDQRHIETDKKIFAYDHIFTGAAKQVQIFQTIALPVVQNVLEGYNGTIFAYGQTGSGKTHTIFGDIQYPQHHGLIPRVIKSLFERKKQNDQIQMSLLQIYKQQLIDLLSCKKDLKIKQTNTGIQIQNLFRADITCIEQSIKIIETSLKNRKIACTKLNDKSSRSHTILTIYISNSNSQTKLCLIDLAGSQKVNKAGVSGDNLEETKKINYSLSCLGNVINALVTRKKSDHVPFRDSKLTRILKDSLSGRFKTSIIVNVSADVGTNDETLSSLKFADRAKKVKVTISKNNLKGKQNVQYLQNVIKKLTCDLEETKKELDKYKQICHDGKNHEQSTGSLQLWSEEKDLQTNQNNIQQQIPNRNQPISNIQRQMETETDITPRPIPSERANAQQNIKKYGKQNCSLRNRLKIPLNSNKGFSKYSKQDSGRGGQQIKRININELSSLNVSRSVGNFFGEINSPSISSLSIRHQDNTEDLSLNFSLQKSESNRQSIHFG